VGIKTIPTIRDLTELSYLETYYYGKGEEERDGKDHIKHHCDSRCINVWSRYVENYKAFGKFAHSRKAYDVDNQITLSADYYPH
jgi:hypothetical protein